MALDDLGSLAHAFAGSTATWDYTYDAVHSRTSLTVSDPQFLYDLSVLVPTTYTNNTMNQQESALLDVPPQPQAVAFSHDLLGNMQTPLTHSYAYDAENRLTTAYVPGGNASYAYDASGLRTRKTFAGETTEYVLDGGQILAEYDGSGALLRRYVYAGLDEPVQMTTASGETYYYHADALGSVVGASDGEGASVLARRYDVYGARHSASGTLNAVWAFTGRRFDAEVDQLGYFRQRYYDVDPGLFSSDDAARARMNWYEYAEASPTRFTDPLGLASVAGTLKVLAGRWSALQIARSAGASVAGAIFDTEFLIKLIFGLVLAGFTQVESDTCIKSEPLTSDIGDIPPQVICVLIQDTIRILPDGSRAKFCFYDCWSFTAPGKFHHELEVPVGTPCPEVI